MHFLTIIPFFLALGLSLMSTGSDWANLQSNSTLATLGPSIEQFSTTFSNGTAFQQSTTLLIAEMSPANNLTNTEHMSMITMFGTSIEQESSSGTTTQQITTTQVVNSVSTIEAIIQIRISDVVGTATVNLTMTDPTSTSFNVESSTTSTSTTTT